MKDKPTVGARVIVHPATTAGHTEHGSVVAVITPDPAYPRAQRITVAFDDGTRCSVPSFRVDLYPDDHGPGCDGPLNCTCSEPEFYVEVRGPDGVIGDSLTYAQAIETLTEVCDEWEAEGYTVDRSWASSRNYAAAKGTKALNADRFVSVERSDG